MIILSTIYAITPGQIDVNTLTTTNKIRRKPAFHPQSSAKPPSAPLNTISLSDL